MRQAVLFFLMVVMGVSFAEAELGRGVDLSQMADWDIVIDAKAIPSELYAAEEFQRFYKQASGIDLPITKEAKGSQKHVYIGPSDAMRALPVGFSVDRFGEEDLRIIIGDDRIIIAGGRPRGTLYGVYTFLEDYVGVRFLTADHTYVPKCEKWQVVGPVDRFYHPPMAFRLSFYKETLSDQAFASRLRNNGALEADPPCYGGPRSFGLVNHSFHKLIPYGTYAKEHPEYFCEINGKRLVVNKPRQPWQPCLTNPEVLKIVTKAVLAELDAHPEMKVISVSQNDDGCNCQCAKCAAIDAREESSMGSLLMFVNAVADEVAKTHPDVIVGTLAYQYSRKPPKTIKPRDNVMIQLCASGCCLRHAIDDSNCFRNVAFNKDLEGWGKICDKIAIWHYNVNFLDFLQPCPNLDVIGETINYYVTQHAIGLFMQGDWQSKGGEMSDLRNYITSRLLWDPTLDARQVRDEFIRLHYGRASVPIMEYIDLMEAHTANKHSYGFMVGPAEFGVDSSIGKKAMALFEKAMRVAENDTIRSRVEKASISAYRAAVGIEAWTLVQKGSSEVLPPDEVERLKPLLSRFFKLCKKYNITKFDECPGGVVDGYKATFEKMLGSKLDD